jgi:hypothetical protein
MIIIMQPPFQYWAAFNYPHDSSLWYPSHRFGLLIHDSIELAIQKID